MCAEKGGLPVSVKEQGYCQYSQFTKMGAHKRIVELKDN